MRAAVAAAGVLGGIAWVGALWIEPLFWVGAVLLSFAAVGAGGALVRKSAVALRVVAAVGFFALTASVMELLREQADDGVVLTLVGLVAVVAGVIVLSRRPASRGSHAR